MHVFSAKGHNASRTSIGGEDFDNMRTGTKHVKGASDSPHRVCPDIRITHPHLYAEESLKGPVMVDTVAQAFESARYQPLLNSRLSAISLNSVPDLVLWAGEEASRSREIMRGSSKSSTSSDVDTLVGAGSLRTSVAASATTRTTLNTGVTRSDMFKALPDLPLEVESISSLHPQRPLSFMIPVKRSYSFSLSSARRASFVSNMQPPGRGKRTKQGGKSFLRRFVITWKRVTNSNRLRRMEKTGRVGGRRDSLKLPFGFELVEPKYSSWWRRDSISRKHNSIDSSVRRPNTTILDIC